MRRVWKIFQRTGRDEDLQEELRAFVDELTARNIARGMTPEEARRVALAETGGVQQVREQTREAWFGSSLETLIRDVRYGARLMARTPGFAFVVIATLGLVIGANATVFSVMHAVLWRPLPYPNADRLVVLDATFRGVQFAGISGREAEALIAEPELFDRLARMVGVDAHVTVDGEMERVPAVSASDDALIALGAEPLAMGRALDSTRDGGVTSDVRSVVISHELWVRLLRSDPAAVGKHIEVNNIDVEVVGVLRPEFRVVLPGRAATPEIVDIWFARAFRTDDWSRGQMTVGRLAPGVSLEAARARIEGLAQRFVADRPSDYAGGPLQLSVDSLHALVTADVSRALWVLAGAVGFVLMIGCVNIANLMLVRARRRAQEIAVRRALGASRLRLARQLVVEAAMLSGLGATVGLAGAQVGVDLIGWLRPEHLPRQATIAVSTEVTLFIAALAGLVSVVFGLVPVFGSRSDMQPLRAGRLALQRPGMTYLQRGMVIAEVALSIIPLVAAGLMLRTFVNLTQTELGFATENIVTAKIAYSGKAFPLESLARVQLHFDAFDRVRKIPGVEDVSAGAPLPFDDWQSARTYAREGETPLARATIQTVMPGFLRVTGTKLRAGREFADEDIINHRSVVVIDERIAEQLWPEGAIGKRLVVNMSTKQQLLLEVIGVSEPVRMTQLRGEAPPRLVLPYHFYKIEQSLVIRTRQDAGVIGPQVKKAIEALGTRRPVYDVRPFGAYVDDAVGDTRFLMLVLAAFAIASILLAAVGLYGTLSYLTSLRTQEFGIRMALGASAWRVLRGVACEGLVLAVIGAAVGFAGAMAMTGTLRGLLYNVTPFDGITLIATAVAVALTALVASTHPAWRAAQVNPTTALRAE